MICEITKVVSANLGKFARLWQLKYFVILLLCVFAATASATTPTTLEETSKNGIKFWAIEDNYLPIVSLKIIFTKSGSAYEAKGKFGLANMTANLLTEGTANISGIKFMQQLQAMATDLSFSADEDNFYITVTCLRENLDESLRLMALAVRAADFNLAAVERVRKTIITDIIKQDESPDAKAMKLFQENYFAGHPYARQTDGDIKDIKLMKKPDFQKFIKNHLAKENMIIGVTGNVSKADMAQLLDKYLDFLPKYQTNINDIAEFIPAENSGRVIKILQDVPQNVLIFGFPGPKRNDSDFYNSYVLNHIVGGGGFESRLMHEVREKRGLAYTIYTYLQTYRKAGLISGYVATKNATAKECLQLIRDEITKIHDKGVLPAELTDAKSYLIGSFPLRMTKNSNLAAFVSSMQYDNLGIDFLQNRNNYIANVSEAEVNKAAARYFDLTKMLVVSVGKNNDL